MLRSAYVDKTSWTLPRYLLTRDPLPFVLLNAKRNQFTPEQRLLEAVLMDAQKTLTINTYRGQHKKWALRQRRKALRWLKDQSDDWIISFRMCCEGLNLDEGLTRKRMLDKIVR